MALHVLSIWLTGEPSIAGKLQDVKIIEENVYENFPPMVQELNNCMVLSLHSGTVSA